MNKWFLGLALLLSSCARYKNVILEQHSIVPKPTMIQARVLYQDPSRMLLARYKMAKAFLFIEQELNITIHVIQENGFKYDDSKNDAFAEGFGEEGMPKPIAEFASELIVNEKWAICNQAYPKDGVLTICVYASTISPSHKAFKAGGVVLGAQKQSTIVISDDQRFAKSEAMFINVLRHELGHQFGADHGTMLMAPAIGPKGLWDIVPFSPKSISEMKKTFRRMFTKS